MNTIFIGIAGGTGSGKTTLTEHLVSRFGDDIAVVHHDNYYKAAGLLLRGALQAELRPPGRLRHGPDDPGPEKAEGGPDHLLPRV